MRYYYSDKELKNMLKKIVILVDTREKENTHILDYFQKNKIKFKEKKLSVGDYSFLVEKDEKLNIDRDILFDNSISIERKGSIDELAINLSTDRERFESELLRGINIRKFLLIEDEQGYYNIMKHNYKSQYSSKSYLGTLFSFLSRYHLDFHFISKDFSGQFIYCILYYYYRNYILYHRDFY